MSPIIQPRIHGLYTGLDSDLCPGLCPGLNPAHYLPDNQRFTETACSPMAARGFCILLIANVLSGRALARGSNIA